MSIVRLGLIIVALLLLASVAGFGQSTIRGVVSDSLTGEVLVGANVVVQGTALGGTTNLEGKFTIVRVPAGSYKIRASYIGYTAKVLVVRVTGADMSVNFPLGPEVVQGVEVVVTGQMKGQVAAINQQLTANKIVNVVSEEKIQELPDANAAEAIGRLPGVSITRSGGEANRIILRGLSDRFGSITVDGMKMASTDVNTRGVDLSTVSQGSLAGIELFKSITSDMDADAIAGTVNLVTKKAPAERLVRVDAKGAYNKLAKTAKQYDF